jgi:hypothetical protein
MNYWVGTRGFATLIEALRWASRLATELSSKRASDLISNPGSPSDPRRLILITRTGDGTVCARVPVSL